MNTFEKIDVVNNPLHLSLCINFDDGSQPFEMENAPDNSGKGWFAPRNFLRALPGVVKCELINMSSSSGDWDGYYAVKDAEGKISIIDFAQENRFPNSGYTLRTGDMHFASYKCSEFHDESDIQETVDMYLEFMPRPDDYGDVWYDEEPEEEFEEA
jgi:hypothetical protein